MKKKLLIVFSILLIGIIVTIIFDCSNFNVTNLSSTIQILQLNIIDNNYLNIVENICNEQVIELINENVTTIAKTDNISSETTNNVAKDTSITTQKTTNAKTSTKEEKKSNTKVNNNTTNSQSTKQETPNQTVKPKEEKITTDNSKPELANSTYRVTNTAIVSEIIKILNNEISKYDDLVSYGSKVFIGNKTSAYAKTTGFTYLFVNDITKGKIASNYTSFPQRVRNTVGAFGNYNVYAEDEYTYDGRGLNPKWCQTLVWIYITF